MKLKLISILLFISVSIGMPLLGTMKLFLSPQIYILVASCIILLFSQPPITIKNSLQEQKTDKLSVLVIMIGSSICIYANVREWASWLEDAHKFSFDGRTVSGLFLITGGTVFRLWAIRTLGKFFTSEVKFQDEQKIIQSGPYGIIRHPSYLGAYMAIIGCSVLLHTSIGLLLSASLMLLAYMYRINVEEQTMAEEFGQAYQNYLKRTYRLIPFLY